MGTLMANSQDISAVFYIIYLSMLHFIKLQVINEPNSFSHILVNQW